MNVADCCETAKEKPLPNYETGNKDDILPSEIVTIYLAVVATMSGFSELV
jgi:hypothetical protein